MRAFAFFAALAAVLVPSLASAAACDGFDDVDSADATYCQAVTYLKDKGITLGCDATHYCPNDPVTRLQMALFLQRTGRGSSTNVLGDVTSTIGGGDNNTAGYQYTVVGGGSNNSASGFAAVVAGGVNNSASTNEATVSGGQNNVASGIGSTIVGGVFNTAPGETATVLGGSNNNALGAGSIVMGNNAQTTALATGSIVIGDGGSGAIGSDTPNEFIVGARGGIRMLSSKNGTTGCSLAAGGGTWACTSAKDAKRDFEEVDRQDVLKRVLALPVQRWRYMNESPGIRHMGTFAGDFRAAFGLGYDDRSITMADADGVALAAIQGLNAKVDAKDAEIADLRQRLARLETAMAH